MQQDRRRLPAWAWEVTTALFLVGFAWWSGAGLGLLLLTLALAALAIYIPERIIRRDAEARARWLNRKGK
jgi:hypothetical protein